MKKIACLSALAAVLAFTAGTSVAATSTVTGGYAQSDAQGQMNKMGGFAGCDRFFHLHREKPYCKLW